MTAPLNAACCKMLCKADLTILSAPPVKCQSHFHSPNSIQLRQNMETAGNWGQQKHRRKKKESRCRLHKVDLAERMQSLLL